MTMLLLSEEIERGDVPHYVVHPSQSLRAENRFAGRILAVTIDS